MLFFFFYLPEKEKERAEIEKMEQAARLMRGKQYTEFVKEHETSKAKKGWFGSWFGKGESKKYHE